MAEAFIKKQGLQPTLLPQMLPFGDIDEDEIIIFSEETAQSSIQVSPAISPIERTLIFMKIILAKPHDFGSEHISLYQACSLAQELGKLLDTTTLENLSFDNLKNLVPEEYATHWQETLKFLEIITSHWPSILKERKVIDQSSRKKQLLSAQNKLWQNNPTSKHIIIAGSTATYPIMKELVKTVSELPNGEIILCGLDKLLDDTSWNTIDETHPQFELKRLLDFIKIDRHQVVDIVPPHNQEREKLISEMMRPASQTHQWRNLQTLNLSSDTVKNLNILNCSDSRTEALNIALIMRKTLETPEKTAALITPDRNLARRVSAELARWNINIDDTAGKPLSLTPWGIFMRLICNASSPNASRISLLSLLKHPLCGLQQSPVATRVAARNLEKNFWRTRQPDSQNEILLKLKTLLQPLTNLYSSRHINLKQLLETHLLVAENIATSDTEDGKNILWKGDSGYYGSMFFAQILPHASLLDKISPTEYLGFFEALTGKISVRPHFGTHPRLKIMGPIEARLSNFDVTIIGGFNENIWPQSSSSDPWMSRPMKKDFGYPLPEKSIGVLGLDLCCFLGGKEVYITRAEKSNGSPTLKSRWLMRLETVLKAFNISPDNLNDKQLSVSANSIDEPQTYFKIKPPAPKPNLKYRPRQLSARDVEVLMRDPYSIFAKHILQLKPLNDIEQELEAKDFGDIIHKILEEYNNIYPHSFPADSEKRLLNIGKIHFNTNPLLENKKAFYWPKFTQMIKHLASLEFSYRPETIEINNEVKGNLVLKQLPGGDFTIIAKADRVDITNDNKINIIDYKTGRARSAKEVVIGYAPQLPIEALIAQNGGFEGTPAKEINKLIYWQLGVKSVVIENDKTKLAINNTYQNLYDLLNRFDFETTPYNCNPNPNRAYEYSDYKHLSRIDEWYINEGCDD